MKKSGLADSPFFASPEPQAEPSPPSPEPPLLAETAGIADVVKEKRAEKPRRRDAKEPRHHDAINASMQANMHASNNASMQSLMHESIIEVIRKAVKDVGKDSATFRFTSEEKKALLELSFSYKMQGYKTSENELTRIAINFLLEEQKQNGRNSVLQRVLDALNK